MKRFIITLFFIFLVSCNMAPKAKKINLDYKVPDKFNIIDTKVSKKTVIEIEWWKQFNDQLLNKIIDEVIDNNLDIKIAISNIKMLEAQFTTTTAASKPKVSASGGYSKTRSPSAKMVINPQTGTMGSSVEADWNNNYSLQTALMYDLDIWGKLKNLERSAIADLMGSKKDIETVYNSIIYQVITIYYNLKALKKDIELNYKTLSIYKDSFNIQNIRYQKGRGNRLNIELLRQSILRVELQIKQKEQQIKLLSNSLKIFLNRYPDLKEIEVDNKIGFLPKLNSLPNIIPSNLLKKRGDILSASYKIESAREMVGYAEADFFPSISISAMLGYQTQKITDLFSSTYFTASGGVSIDYPIYSGGVKDAALKQRKIAYKQSILNYKKVILNAFKEVQDSLIKIKNLKKQRENIIKQIEITKDILEMTKDRYLKGLYSYDKVLDTENNLFTIKSSLITIEKNYLLARVEFYKAIGGNWVKSDKSDKK